MSKSQEELKALAERQQKEKMKFRKDEAEMGKYMLRIQDNCPHKTSDQWWDIGLQHNFPDMLPRGVCLRCDLIIAPRHWESAGPGEVKVVPAHHLYPIVVALEQQDYALAILRDVYLAAVDSLITGSEARLITDLDWLYAKARGAVCEQCQRDIEDSSIFTGAA